jgi:serine phosphatase RsbU (regulator of sigma subunit)
VILVIISLMIFSIRSYLKKKEMNFKLIGQNIIIAEKNCEILDSINYAQRIQRSILPPLIEVGEALPESFILYKPKDIVSGDFYWFSRTSEKILIAAADCTGHGVPGAFMSAIGSEKLNEAVIQTDDVSDILKGVNIRMKKVLHQSEKKDSTRDGMDIAICAFNKEMTQLEYAGANRPIWIVRNGIAIIEEIKATKAAIGGYTVDEQEFIKHEISLEKGDTVYMFSDGFADQFNLNGKKLMAKKFKEAILSIMHKSMQDQKSYLDTFIEAWRGEMEQTDDILVIGVRV